ncbi:MAG: type III pantothenate kinase, partial [Lachnospiraceae bacterium]|nr:type III pantothenate kinase [Lachnospiraceae bacterium]
TARLPEVEIRNQDSILAQNTVTSMQAGLVYGQIGQTEYIVNQVKKETGYDEIRVIATGGLGSIIADETECIEIYDRTLTLDGLRYIYQRNCR